MPQSTSDSLPSSVVGAPAHLREAIRRAQNAAAARRSRARRKEGETIEALEERVRVLETGLAAAGHAVPDEDNGAEGHVSEDGDTRQDDDAETEAQEMEDPETEGDMEPEPDEDPVHSAEQEVEDGNPF